MLATTIHKSNTTPHHQSRGNNKTPTPTNLGAKAGTTPNEEEPRACCLKAQ